MNHDGHLHISNIQNTYHWFDQKILESCATPNWSNGSVGQKESRSQVPDPQSRIPNPRSWILNPKSKILNPKIHKLKFQIWFRLESGSIKIRIGWDVSGVFSWKHGWICKKKGNSTRECQKESKNMNNEQQMNRKQIVSKWLETYVYKKN